MLSYYYFINKDVWLLIWSQPDRVEQTMSSSVVSLYLSNLSFWFHWICPFGPSPVSCIRTIGEAPSLLDPCIFATFHFFLLRMEMIVTFGVGGLQFSLSFQDKMFIAWIWCHVSSSPISFTVWSSFWHERLIKLHEEVLDIDRYHQPIQAELEAMSSSSQDEAEWASLKIELIFWNTFPGINNLECIFHFLFGRSGWAQICCFLKNQNVTDLRSPLVWGHGRLWYSSLAGQLAQPWSLALRVVP